MVVVLYVFSVDSQDRCTDLFLQLYNGSVQTVNILLVHKIFELPFVALPGNAFDGLGVLVIFWLF